MGTFIKAVFKGKCAITFDFDGGTSTDSNTKDVPRGTTWAKIKDSVTAPTKEGHTFQHWSTSQGGDAITDGYKFKDDTVTIYAVWEIVGVTISFNLDGGSPEIENKTVDYGTTWAQIKDSVTAPSKTGFNFTHWSTSAGGTAIGDEVVFNTDTTIFAVFEIIRVTVTFNSDGATTAPDPKTVDYGTTWAQIKDSVTAPSKTGFNFTHWSTSAGGTAIGDEVVFNTDTTIFAVYSVIRVTVSFNPDGGSPTPDPKTVDYGTTWGQIKNSVTAPTKAGYTFLGWEVA